MSRITSTFERLAAQQRKALIPFITAGDPDEDTTLALMHAMVGAGADVIELGVPFSDPMADGPTIQRASDRALAAGMTLTKVLQLVARFRQQDSQTPVVLMGYLNPIESMGLDAFIEQARTAQIDGVLTVDCPPQESHALVKGVSAASIAPVFLLAPTSQEERFRQVAQLGGGYVYYVSLKGVTGAANLDVDDVGNRLAAIRQHVKLPIVVGFGIRDAASAQRVAALADGVVIGSRIIDIMTEAESSAAGIAAVSEFIKAVRTALNALSGE